MISTVSPEASGPSLPRIGQPDYVPLLIKSLQTYHAPIQLDSHIFIGMLLALVTGEKNLIVDVDTNQFLTQHRAGREQHSAHEETLPPDRSNDEYEQALAEVEARVEAMVEYVSALMRSLPLTDICDLDNDYENLISRNAAIVGILGFWAYVSLHSSILSMDSIRRSRLPIFPRQIPSTKLW